MKIRTIATALAGALAGSVLFLIFHALRPPQPNDSVPGESLASESNSNAEATASENNPVAHRAKVGAARIQQTKNSNSLVSNIEEKRDSADSGNSAQRTELTHWLSSMEGYSEAMHEQFKQLREIASRNGSDSQDAAARVFAPMREVFLELGRSAATNDAAMRVLFDAAQRPFLQGTAVQGIGAAAANGNEEALTALLNYRDRGWLLSSALSALHDNIAEGDSRSVQFAYDISTDRRNAALWYMTAETLNDAAAHGNEQAVAGLVNLSASENPSVRDEVVSGLTQAAAHGNSTAQNALRTIRNGGSGREPKQSN